MEIDDPVYKNLKSVESINSIMLSSNYIMPTREDIAKSQSGIMNCIRMIEKGTMPEEMYNHLKGKSRNDLSFEFASNYPALSRMIKEAKGNFY